MSADSVNASSSTAAACDDPYEIASVPQYHRFGDPLLSNSFVSNYFDSYEQSDERSDKNKENKIDDEPMPVTAAVSGGSSGDSALNSGKGSNEWAPLSTTMTDAEVRMAEGKKAGRNGEPLNELDIDRVEQQPPPPQHHAEDDALFRSGTASNPEAASIIQRFSNLKIFGASGGNTARAERAARRSALAHQQNPDAVAATPRHPIQQQQTTNSTVPQPPIQPRMTRASTLRVSSTSASSRSSGLAVKSLPLTTPAPAARRPSGQVNQNQQQQQPDAPDLRGRTPVRSSVATVQRLARASSQHREDPVQSQPAVQQKLTRGNVPTLVVRRSRSSSVVRAPPPPSTAQVEPTPSRSYPRPWAMNTPGKTATTSAAAPPGQQAADASATTTVGAGPLTRQRARNLGVQPSPAAATAAPKSIARNNIPTIRRTASVRVNPTASSLASAAVVSAARGTPLRSNSTVSAGGGGKPTASLHSTPSHRSTASDQQQQQQQPQVLTPQRRLSPKRLQALVERLARPKPIPGAVGAPPTLSTTTHHQQQDNSPTPASGLPIVKRTPLRDRLVSSTGGSANNSHKSTVSSTTSKKK